MHRLALTAQSILLAVAATAAAGPAPATADACPWLGADVAAQVILAPPTEVKLEKDPVPANPDGMVSATTCRFKRADELVGQLSVIVMEYGSDAGAKARYERELASQGSRARPARIEGNPAYFTMNPGFSAASFATKGRRVVFVSHTFSKRVSEAIKKDPDGAVLSTHEVARQVLAKLR